MKNLIKAAKELNEKLGLNPGIKVIGIKKEKLVAALLEAAEELEQTDEKTISKQTFEVLEEIGAEFDWREDADEDADEDDDDLEDTLEDADLEDLEDDEEDEEDDEEEEEEEKVPVKNKKGASKKEPVKKEPLKKEDTKKKEEPKKIKKEEKGASAYGTAIDIMCANPNIDLKELYKLVSKAGIDTASKKSAINTAYSCA